MTEITRKSKYNKNKLQTYLINKYYNITYKIFISWLLYTLKKRSIYIQAKQKGRNYDLRQVSIIFRAWRLYTQVVDEGYMYKINTILYSKNKILLHNILIKWKQYTYPPLNIFTISTRHNSDLSLKSAFSLWYEKYKTKLSIYKLISIQGRVYMNKRRLRYIKQYITYWLTLYRKKIRMKKAVCILNNIRNRKLLTHSFLTWPGRFEIQLAGVMLGRVRSRSKAELDKFLPSTIAMNLLKQRQIAHNNQHRIHTNIDGTITYIYDSDSDDKENYTTNTGTIPGIGTANLLSTMTKFGQFQHGAEPEKLGLWDRIECISNNLSIRNHYYNYIKVILHHWKVYMYTNRIYRKYTRNIRYKMIKKRLFKCFYIWMGRSAVTEHRLLIWIQKGGDRLDLRWA